ncbi:MAG: VanW family protein [Clostridiales bacterium]|jgi:vancomycin resistance protein YoaR|nr:VanW family protein [Clostridiales bacterium]
MFSDDKNKIVPDNFDELNNLNDSETVPQEIPETEVQAEFPSKIPSISHTSFKLKKPKNKRHEKNKMILIISSSVFLFLVLVTILLISLNNILSKKTIYNGVSVGYTNVSGMTLPEAKDVLKQEYVNSFDSKSITIDYLGKTWPYSMSEFTTYPDTDKLAEDAYAIGRSGNFISRLIQINNLKKSPKYFDVVVSVNEEKAVDITDQICSELDKDVENPSYTILTDTITFTPGNNGCKVDKNKLLSDLKAAIANQNIETVTVSAAVTEMEKLNYSDILSQVKVEPKDASFSKSDKTNLSFTNEIIGKSIDEGLLQQYVDDINNGSRSYLQLPVTSIEPQVTVAKLNEIIFKDTLSSNTTIYNIDDTNHSNNILIALNKLNGIILMPGEEFNFLDLVGSITEENGFTDALIDVFDGPDFAVGADDPNLEIGGGVSQLASSLYAAALYSNFEILERHPHTYIPNFTAIGTDADIYNGANLIFKNTSNYPVKIVLSMNSGFITLNIMGTKDFTGEVEVNQENLNVVQFSLKYEDDPSLPKGEVILKLSGIAGYTLDTYRGIKVNGVLQNETLVISSVYQKRDAIYLRGTKES